MSRKNETRVSKHTTEAIGGSIPTTYRRAVLEAIHDLDGSLSPTLTARVLQGRKTAVVRGSNLDQAPAFGILRGATRRQVRSYIDDLAAAELVAYGLGGVHITKAGKAWLSSRKGVSKASKAPVEDLTPDEEFDELAKGASKPKPKTPKGRVGFDEVERRLAKTIKSAGAYKTLRLYPQVAEALGIEDTTSQNPDDYPSMGEDEFYNFAFAVIAGDRVEA